MESMLRFAKVRVAWIAIVIALSAIAPADTIYLKNGRTIYADKVSENGSRLYYEVGEDTYAIPRSLVERIESGGVPPVRSSSRPETDRTEAPDLSGSIAGSDAVALKIIRDGRVDSEALAAVERAGDRNQAAAGFFIAGKHEYERGDSESARQYFDHALSYAPQNDTILTNYAVVLIQLGRAADAVPFAERATRAAADSADAWGVLGFALYSLDRLPQAIAAWKKSLALRPNASVQAHLERAQREVAAEAEFTETDTGHFTIRYEGSTTAPALRQQVQASLENSYDDLVRDLGILPKQNIAVLLYTNKAFFDVTEAPSWISALNDGKLRIPVQGLTGVTPELGRVLKHELAHSFINQVARGRCPQWLNEGLAQVVEPKQLGSSRGRQLAELFRTGRQIPLSSLEKSFMGFSTIEALLAYDESLAAADYIRDMYGISELRRVLERIGEGASAESALRATVHSGYADLEEQVGRHLYQKFGK